MKRLPFRLKEYAPRITWASAQAREVWEPRIQRVSNAYLEAERGAVQMGYRSSTLQFVSPDGLPAYMASAAKSGHIVTVLSQTQNVDGYGSAQGTGTGWSYKVAYSSPKLAEAWTEAWQANNDDRIGELLGYPQCCRQFFERIWKEDKWFDTTIPQFEAEKAGSFITVSPYSNLLWRWHGVRLISHLACSAQCAESQTIGEKHLDAMRALDPEAAMWAQEILNWPVLYTSLHGIAEITTPIHRFHVASDAVAERVELKFKGNRYPDEGASGGFPHKYKSQPAKPLQLVTQSHKNNGFATADAQMQAHNELVSFLIDRSWGTVLDLGCGDGTLLRKIRARRRVGVEIKPETAELAKKHLDRVVVGDVTDPYLLSQLLLHEQPDLVIAQQDRNPLGSFTAPYILSYTYEGTTRAQLWAPPNVGA